MEHDTCHWQYLWHLFEMSCNMDQEEATSWSKQSIALTYDEYKEDEEEEW